MDLTQDPNLQQVVKKNRVQRFKNHFYSSKHTFKNRFLRKWRYARFLPIISQTQAYLFHQAL